MLEKACASATNAYNIPNVSINAQCCKTNLPSKTAFRGFGAPQGMKIAEDIMDTVAYTLNMDPLKVFNPMHHYVTVLYFVTYPGT